MAQKKKDYIPLHIKMDSAIMHRFESYCDDVGQTKTLAIERIVSAYLDQYEQEQQEIAALKGKK